jgi:hypothetical protein
VLFAGLVLLLDRKSVAGLRELWQQRSRPNPASTDEREAES